MDNAVPWSLAGNRVAQAPLLVKAIGNHKSSQLISGWYDRPNGQYVLDSLKSTLEPVLTTAFGYHAVQIGLSSRHQLLDHSPINHRIYLADQADLSTGLIANADELPLESDSIDLLLAHHSLEFGPNPHAVLREIHRVLAPQGQLVIVGFNPYSMLGMGSVLRKAVGNELWRQQRAVSRHRMSDWLHLLGCEVQSCQYIYDLPPVGSGALNAALVRADKWLGQHKLPTGGLYILHAIKQMHGINRPRLRLRERGERLIGLAVPKPAAAPSPTPALPAKDKYFQTSGDVAA
ncbi:MAG: SAM-dependent methyltransferase [Halioglobus sp.]|jgi:SAM-dependent methyltransferase